jgi:hypothetical protein
MGFAQGMDALSNQGDSIVCAIYPYSRATEDTFDEAKLGCWTNVGDLLLKFGATIGSAGLSRSR